MTIRPLRRLFGASVLAFVGVLGTTVTGASASATNFPAPDLGPIPMSALPSAGPGVNVSGDCPGYLFTDGVVIQFLNGTAVLYGPASNPNTFGGNAQGDATLTFNSSGGSADATYTGHTHLWFGVNSNNKGQFYSGQTASFNGDGLTITASGGETISNSGHVSGWGHVNVRCS